MATQITVEPAEDEQGMWYWRFAVDGETYADGNEPTARRAQDAAARAYYEWSEKNQ